MNLKDLENLLEQKIATVASNEDPAHDLLHFKRVVQTAKKLCAQENADLHIVLPAAWLHDLVIVPKNDPRRKQASKLSAIAAIEFLKSINYPEHYFPAIGNAIEAHSFSANIEALTIEAKIVQDADRLDGLGAIGVARCFATAGLLQRSFYSEQDPFCEQRQPDDSKFTVDHFFAKLYKTAESLQTVSGKQEGQHRLDFMKKYMSQLSDEINSNS